MPSNSSPTIYLAKYAPETEMQAGKRHAGTGGTLYKVRIAGLLSEADGTAVAIRLKAELGLQQVAVSLQ